MNQHCPVCDLPFEREEGYFLGAMMIDYGLGLVIVSILAVAIWLIARWGFDKTLLVAFLVFIPGVPAVTRMGRILWIYFDRTIDPGKSWKPHEK
jgi:hypothetical protein